MWSEPLTEASVMSLDPVDGSGLEWILEAMLRPMLHSMLPLRASSGSVVLLCLGAVL